jgi:SWI/SNF-related matrix-associated actin-dependent regulator of chromatin subfamily A3
MRLKAPSLWCRHSQTCTLLPNFIPQKNIQLIRSAHLISNRATNTSRAIFALQAETRWAVTGTPFQNRLSDLATICQFLRVHPYDDPKIFESDITRVWRMGSDGLAIARLKRLLQCILLRRATSIVDLPKRNDLRITLRFTEERVHYQTAERNVITNIDAALNHSNAPQSTYLNVLQQINELRLICDQGTHRTLGKSQASQLRGWDPKTAQKAFEALTAAGSLLCFKCGFDMDIVEDALGLGSNLANYRYSPQMYSCLRVFCAGCVGQNAHLSCGHNPTCEKASVAKTPGEAQSNASLPSSNHNALEGEALPTKVQALLQDLQSLPEGHKKYVYARSAVSS